MNYVGIDLYKQSITVCVVDQDRTVTQTRRRVALTLSIVFSVCHWWRPATSADGWY